MTSGVLFYLNGERVELGQLDLDTTLLQYLRGAGLTGTKLGCGEGGCGACTVMVSRYDVEQQRVEHASVNACLYPLYAVDGKHVVTVEGLGTARDPHPVQERIALLHGSQCGFCTPGFVMSLYVLLRNKPAPTERDIEECFDGNLCRCTGYRPILDAAKTFADLAWKRGAVVEQTGTVHVDPAQGRGGGGCGIKDCCQLKKEGGSSGGDSQDKEAECCKSNGNEAECCKSNGNEAECCKSNGMEPGCCKSNSKDAECCKSNSKDAGCCKNSRGPNQAEADKLAVIARFKKYEPTQELIFPPFLIQYAKGTAGDGSRRLGDLALVSSDSESWCQRAFRPVTLDGLLAVLQAHPGAKLVAGNSEVGVEVRLKRARFPVQVYVGDIGELRAVREDAAGVAFGANLPLARVERELERLVAAHGAQRTQGLAAVRESLRYFAGNQIRNVATMAGNIVTASPISDLNPALVAAGAVATLAGAGGARRQVALADFFVGYRRTALRAGEVLVSVHVPFSAAGEVVRAFKQAKRKDDDIAIVTCGLRVRVDGGGRVREAAFAYGGMAPTTVLARAAMGSVAGAQWGDAAVLERLVGACQDELRLDFAVPGGMAEYRAALATGFLVRFWAASCAQLGIACAEAQWAHEAEDSAERQLTRGQQEFAPVADRAVVGHGVAHLSALKQTTGEARYVDDMPPVHGELAVALVTADRPHARIGGVDAGAALAMPGVRRVLTARDIPGSNVWNVFHDEELLATDEVHHVGQPIALVVADSRRRAHEAARAVRVVYSEDLPAVLTVRDAVAAGAWFPEQRRLQTGDVAAALAAADHVISGSSYCGGQEHFYLEPFGAVAVPRGEDGELDVYASSQNPTETQMVCAEMLGLPASRVVCHVKRMGGGFGGKESRPAAIAAFAALAAHHTGRAARLVLDRDEDMQLSGQRHPFYATWTVGVARDGRLLGLRMHLYSNGGFSRDLSIGVLERALAHADNCYRIPSTELVGRVCRTNTQSNTAFRGFGGCQGMLLLESMLCEVADHLRMPVDRLRELNMYRAGDATPFGQTLGADWNVPHMWARIQRDADYVARRAAVDAFNAQSRFRKRGLALLPTKFAISFGVKHLNQGMALVHIYADGSVLVAHGGTEMGQGLHTKMAQVAAETLRVPLDAVFISETATNTAANTSPTAASASSDLNGHAVHNACRELAARLEPYRARAAPDAPFAQIARAAYLDRCSLTASGHYATPGIDFDWAAGQLRFAYFTQGVAVAEVELDTLTGAHSTRRVDILMDVGRSLNKAIDIGQIEGAFTQGQGWTTMEEFLYSPATGRVLTQGPGAYKIPSAMDIPRDFRVALLEDTPAPPKTIFSSKGVGEPPLFLGASVFFALRDAVLAARAASPEAQAAGVLHLESPATPESLRLACEDRLTALARIPAAQKQGAVPFAVRI
ncbi:hypothetical protein H4R18_001160 [Coemansia javaensis]|uniref:xanthine dehydrogenase n=1 Tax=Coemansia javaensis TaxID=2761396 RepID=A0A9W8HDS4_9FUNG|nr:hypothetical protein H4R18_001160 [Coemansia javaensis]